VLVAGLLLLLTGCSGPFPQSVFHARSDFAVELDGLFWNVFWWAVVVFLIVETLLLVAIARFRARPGAAMPKPVHGHTLLEIGWTLAPALILVFIAVPTMRTIFSTAGHAAEGALRVEVIGHQWWWEYRYPTLGVSTANELHLPVGTPVQVEMTSADVIHSFWAPGLGGKRDLMQGRTNRIAFRADSTGEYWGQCAEFCGASHANMRFTTVVLAPDAFDRWVAGQRAPASEPSGPAAEGKAIYARSACVGCHTIRGVSGGVVAPDLTHFGSRKTLAAGLYPNTVDHVARWILDPPAMKPGAKMPSLGLTAAEARAVATYLTGLK
jgi:cytochrome c oxidase subunit 2